MENKKISGLVLITLLFLVGCAQEDTLTEDGFTNKQGSFEAAPTSTTSTQAVASTYTPSSSSTTKTTTTTTTTTTITTTSTTSTTFAGKKQVRVEVVYFYPISPCANCKRMGQLAEETIYMYYSKELASGKLSFIKVNYQDPANKAILTKYGPTSSSLWIGTYIGDEFYKEPKIAVWYKTSDPEEYHRYLKSFIDKRLRGDLSLGSLT